MCQEQRKCIADLKLPWSLTTFSSSFMIVQPGNTAESYMFLTFALIMSPLTEGGGDILIYPLFSSALALA